jgi:hypothetical protein
MVRFLIFLLGMLTTNRAGNPPGASFRAADSYRRSEPTAPYPPDETTDGDPWFIAPESLAPWRPGGGFGAEPGSPDRPGISRGRRPRRIPLKVKWAAIIVLIGLIFRKVIAFAVLAALSAALHLMGFNVHLPHIKLTWPWQSISAGTTTDTQIGPWVLQKIEGISRPALGTENFNFTFTHKVSKSIGIWPCWYSSTFAAVGRASATVDLNPGPTWWSPATGHYRLQILSRPVTGKPGQVSVTIALPQPQLPQSVHDITIDNTLSHPIDTQHSWTYPGLGCGALIRPQFSVSVLYAQAQSIAFGQARTNPQITRPLIGAAETEAARIIRDNFIQPTVNALGYTLVNFTIHWAARS